MNDKILSLKKKRDSLRIEWQSFREMKLARKRELAWQGTAIELIRRDKLYRQFRKSQHYVSKQIKHLEIQINRHINRNRINVI